MKTWLNRQRALADYTLAALARRRVKNAFLVLVFAAVVFFVASAMLFSSALRHEADLVLQDAPELIVQRLIMGRQDLIPAAEVDKLAGIRGVAKAQGRLWGYFYDRINGANYTVMVPNSPEFDLRPGQAVLGEAIGRSRGFTWEGAPLIISRSPGDLQKFTVIRTLSSDSALVTADLVLVSEPDFRSFFDIPQGVFTDIAVTVRNERELDTIIDKASKLMPEARFVTRAEIRRTYQKLFDWREGIMVALAAAAILAFVIFAAEKATGLSAEEAREIGILKAIGWDTRDVIAMKLWEGALIAVTAYLAGVVGAYLHVFIFKAALFAPVLKGWAVLYPDFALAPRLDMFQLTALFMIVVLPYLAAVLVPIWRVASSDPDQVMR